MNRSHSRWPNWPSFLTALLCALILFPLSVDAQKKKGGGKSKPPKDQQQAPPPSGSEPAPPPAAPAEVRTVDRKLWEYRTAEARSAVQAVADQADSNGAVAVAMGRVLEQEQKYGEAESRLRRATELSPSDPAAQVWLGEVLLRQRNSGGADSAFRKAADLASAGGSDYYLGVAKMRLRQFDEAAGALERARKADGGNPLIPYQLGLTRLFQEQWQPALDQLSQSVEMDSGLAYGYYYRGLAAEKLGRKDLLVNDMSRFVELAPNAPEAERARAILRAVKK